MGNLLTFPRICTGQATLYKDASFNDPTLPHPNWVLTPLTQKPSYVDTL